MQSRIIAVTALVSLSCSQLQAAEADLNISNKAVNGQLNLINADRSVEFGAGYVYRKGGVNVANLDLHARGQTAIGNLPTTVGLGAQFASMEEGVFDGSALALGGYAHVKIPEVPGLGVRAALHFSPSITSFGDAEQYARFDARVTYRVISNADVYGGYRSIVVDTSANEDLSLDENVHLGVTIFF